MLPTDNKSKNKRLLEINSWILNNFKTTFLYIELSIKDIYNQYGSKNRKETAHKILVSNAQKYGCRWSIWPKHPASSIGPDKQTFSA